MTNVPSAPLADSHFDRLADQLVDARASGVPLNSAAAAAMPATDADAYRVQTAVTAKLGRRVAGWKVGAASLSATPNCAPIYDILPASGSVPAVGSTGIELEIAFTLARDFPAAAVAPSRDAVTAAIGSAHVVLETCAARLAEGIEAPALLRLADNGINLGLVVGPRVEAWRTLDAKGGMARVEANGAVIAETTGGHTSPDLIGLLTWLVGHVVTTRGGLAAGTIVTTGSWMGIKFVTTPARVRGTCLGIGSIETTVG